MPERSFPNPPEGFPNLQATDYQVVRTPLIDPGLVPVPAAGPAGTPMLFARVRAPVEMELISWVATSVGGPPQAPSPYGPNCPFGLNENRILLRLQIGVIVPPPNGGSAPGHAWSLSGAYLYGKVQPEGITNMPLGVMPWEQNPSNPQFPNYMPGGNFVQGILDPGYPAPLFPLPPSGGGTMGNAPPP